MVVAKDRKSTALSAIAQICFPAPSGKQLDFLFHKERQAVNEEVILWHSLRKVGRCAQTRTVLFHSSQVKELGVIHC
jgi:hypothetical protein